MVKSINYHQDEIIKDILVLHNEGNNIDCDPTYSKGIFYKNIPRPPYTSDIDPWDILTMEADCRNLPYIDNFIQCMMFDPPFVVSSGPSLLQDVEGQNIISKRFSSFKSIPELWNFYNESLVEFYRVIRHNGILIFKCQDTVSSGKNYMSHVKIINMAEDIGFYCKDIFVLLAKSRIMSGKWKTQKHARKFHSYFLVFIKK